MTRAGGFTGLLFLLAVLTVGGGSCGGQDDMLNTEQFQLSPNSWSNDNTLIACPECESGCLDCLACQNRCERDCETDASCSDPEPCLDQCRQGVVCRDCSICMFNCHYWSEPQRKKHRNMRLKLPYEKIAIFHRANF